MSNKRLHEVFRDLRKAAHLPLRKVAAALDIDVAILSKVERGKRPLSKSLVRQLAGIYQQNPETLLIQFLSERLLNEIKGEEFGSEALLAAESAVQYRASKSYKPSIISKEEILDKFPVYFKTRPKISRAYLFGSYARNDENDFSDIDIALDVPEHLPFTLFDLEEIREDLEKIAARKVDVVMLNGIRDYMRSRIEKEMVMVYESR